MTRFLHISAPWSIFNDNKKNMLLLFTQSNYCGDVLSEQSSILQNVKNTSREIFSSDPISDGPKKKQLHQITTYIHRNTTEQAGLYIKVVQDNFDKTVWPLLGTRANFSCNFLGPAESPHFQGWPQKLRLDASSVWVIQLCLLQPKDNHWLQITIGYLYYLFIFNPNQVLMQCICRVLSW